MEKNNTQALYTAALTGLLSLALLAPATATDFSGSLKEVSIADAQGANKAPTAAFSYTVSGETVTFDASGSSDTDGTITEYKWDFGDGLIKSGPIVSQTISNFSAYATLTIIDDKGSITIIKINVPNLKNKLLAHFSFDATNNGQWYENISGSYLGSTVGSVTPKPGGYSANCIETSTSSNYVGIPIKEILSEKNVFTFQYYIKVTGDITESADSGLYFYSPNNGNYLQLKHEIWDAGAQITYRNGWGTLAQISKLGPDNLTPNTWHKIELIVDFPNNQISYFKDNILVGKLENPNITKWTLDTSPAIVLFKSAPSGPTLSIDEYKIYSGATQ